MQRLANGKPCVPAAALFGFSGGVQLANRLGALNETLNFLSLWPKCIGDALNAAV